jgi:hypothetical protein
VAATRLTPDVRARDRTLFGQVRSVHRAAIYVDLDGPDGLLVVAIDDVGGVPGGILVGGVTDLRETAIEPAMAFRPDAVGWSLPSAGIAIDSSRAVGWSPTLPAAAAFSLTPAVAWSADAVRRLAADRAPEGGLAPMLSDGDEPADPWLARARVLIGTQLTALTAGDVASAVGATVGLIGLGVGLTPSGDDYLVGLLAGLEASGNPARNVLAAAIATHAPGRTTTIGASMLVHATRGAFAERLHDVLVAIASGRQDALSTLIGRAVAYGATSGTDTLVGMLAALDLARAHPSTVTRSAA